MLFLVTQAEHWQSQKFSNLINNKCDLSLVSVIKAKAQTWVLYIISHQNLENTETPEKTSQVKSLPQALDWVLTLYWGSPKTFSSHSHSVQNSGFLSLCGHFGTVTSDALGPISHPCVKTFPPACLAYVFWVSPGAFPSQRTGLFVI